MRTERESAIRLLRLMMVASLVLPAALFAYASWVGYRAIHAVADERIARSLDVMQEQTLKVFETVDRTFAEVETAARWGINAVTVVNNNGGGNQSKRGFDRVYGGQQTPQARELWTFSKVNFARIAEDMGALGIRVEQASAFPAALKQALAANRPAVIDVVTDIEALAPTAVA